jgi:hypothetical protein
MLAKGSNSGVYLQGLYELQIFDSWGSTGPMETSDGGAIYHRWIGEQGVGGSPPLVNASRRPGEWQSYQAWFRAPRFDAAGKRIEPARFQRFSSTASWYRRTSTPTARRDRISRSWNHPESAHDSGRSWAGRAPQHLCAPAEAADRPLTPPPN